MANKLFFTADQHFGHPNILNLANRPFRNIKEMDSRIIYNFNAVVRPNDTVWHLGDFYWLNNVDMARKIFARLNGKHNFLAGNHDRWYRSLKREGLSISNVKIHEPLVEIKHEKQVIVLCHYPLATWRKMYGGSWMLHGHCHSRYKPPYGKILDVGVDNNNFFPFNFEKIKDYMSKREIMHEGS